MPKPPSNSVKLFRVRVDGSDDEKLINFCKKYFSRYMLVHHVLPTDGKENPHYHMYCETTLTQGNLSNKIKLDLDVKGGDYSNKTCDNERKNEYLTYLFNSKKGNKARYVLCDGFSIIDVATFKENSEAITHEFEERMKKTKLTQFEIAEKVQYKMEGKVMLPEAIYDVTIETLKECRTMARPNHVKDIIATVMAFSKCSSANRQIKELTLKFFFLLRSINNGSS